MSHIIDWLRTEAAHRRALYSDNDDAPAAEQSRKDADLLTGAANEIELLTAWVEQLCQALHEHGDHLPGCKVDATDDEEDCTCGYNAAFELPGSKEAGSDG